MDNTIDRSLFVNLSSPDVLATYTEGQLVAAMRFNLNAEKTMDEHYTVAFDFGHAVHAIEIRRGVAEIHEDFKRNSALTIGLDKEAHLGVVSGQVDIADATQKGVITVKGDASLVPEFFGSFDTRTDAPVLTVR